MDLSTATTIELINELRIRSNALVFGMDPLADQGEYLMLRYGSNLMCSGLLRSLTLSADQQLIKDRREATGGD